MSISGLLYPNSYDLYGNSVNVKNLISQILDVDTVDVTGTLTSDNLDVTNSLTSGTADVTGLLTAGSGSIASLISNKITQTSGFNYLSPWSSTKSYIVGDQVISSGFIWKCLIANTNIQPDPNTPSQTQWVQLSSNNAILNEAQYCQINQVVGDDSKALISPTAFKTPRAAINYLKTKSGGVAKIMSINQTYTDPSGGAFTACSNMVIDGGDESDSIQSNPTNTLDYYMFMIDCIGFTFKNLTWSAPGVGNEVLNTRGTSDNFTLQNINFIDKTGAGNSPVISVGDAINPFGSHSFINCWMPPTDSNGIALIMAGPPKPNCIILIDNAGLTSKSWWNINNQTVTSGSNLTMIVRNSYVATSNFSHTDGSTMIFSNCIFLGGGTFNSTASSGALVLNNCSFFDPKTNTWCGVNINMTGTATYLLIDCLTNPNSTTDVIQSVSTSSANVSSGPASKMNRLAILSTTPVATTSLTTATALQLGVPQITSNTFGIVSQSTVTNTFRILTPGNFNVFLNLELQGTINTAELTTTNLWLGLSGSTETTAPAVAGSIRPLIANTQIGTYPNARFQQFFGLVVNATTGLLNTDLYVYARNLGAVTYTARIMSVSVVQVR